MSETVIGLDVLAEAVSRRTARHIILAVLAAVMIWFYAQVLLGLIEDEEIEPAGPEPIPFPGRGLA